MNEKVSVDTGTQISSGSTLLLIRSYREARNLFALSLSINLLLIVLALTVNAFICYIMIRGKRYKRNRSNLFITHLSMVELVYRLLIFPLLIYLAVPSSGIQSFHCKVVSFFLRTSASAIFVSLVAIAADEDCTEDSTEGHAVVHLNVDLLHRIKQEPVDCSRLV